MTSAVFVLAAYLIVVSPMIVLVLHYRRRIAMLESRIVEWEVVAGNFERAANEWKKVARGFEAAAEKWKLASDSFEKTVNTLLALPRRAA